MNKILKTLMIGMSFTAISCQIKALEGQIHIPNNLLHANNLLQVQQIANFEEFEELDEPNIPQIQEVANFDEPKERLDLIGLKGIDEEPMSLLEGQAFILQDAVRANDIPAIEEMVLRCVAPEDRFELITQLIEIEMDGRLVQKSALSWTVFDSSFKKDEYAIAKFFIDSVPTQDEKEKLIIEDKNGRNPALVGPVIYGNIKLIDLMIKTIKSENKKIEAITKSYFGRTLLHEVLLQSYSTDLDKVKIINRIIDQVHDKDIRQKWLLALQKDTLETALHIAVYREIPEVVDSLKWNYSEDQIEQSEFTSARNGYGHIALDNTENMWRQEKKQLIIEALSTEGERSSRKFSIMGMKLLTKESFALGDKNIKKRQLLEESSKTKTNHLKQISNIHEDFKIIIRNILNTAEFGAE